MLFLSDYEDLENAEYNGLASPIHLSTLTPAPLFILNVRRLILLSLSVLLLPLSCDYSES